jgi:signal transduction histidine kinase
VRVPLKVLLFLVFLPIVLFPAIVTGLSAQRRYEVDSAAVQREIFVDLVQVGGTQLGLISGLMGNAQELAQELALGWPVLRAQGDPNTMLELLSGRSRVFASLGVVSADGRIRYSSDHSAIGRPLAGEPYWARYQQSRRLTFSSLQRDAQGRRIIHILVPAADGETLLADYDTAQLQTAFQSPEAQHLQRFSVLTDGEGNVIAHSSEARLLSHPNLKHMDPVARALQGERGTMEFTDVETGEARDAAYSPVPLTGWALVLSQPTATSILTPVATTYRITLMTLATSVLLAMLATMLLSRRLATPIERASQGLQRLNQEAVSLEHLRDFPTTPIAEFEGVIRGIRRLYESLAHNILELEAKNHELIFSNQQLEASVENYKRLDKLRSDFINILSHDLRIPLTAIIGYAELLEDDPALPPQDKEYVRQIQEACERMNSQLEELLDYARMEVGNFKLHLEPVELETEVPALVAFFRPIAARKGLSLDLDVAEGLPTIRIDPDRLRQILNNLISNAIKYTPSGGRVRVVARASGPEVVLEVRDTGIGLTADDRTHLFEKFFRSERPEVRAEMGTGLGLSLVKGVVEAHGGRLEAEGEPGKGSTFRVILPIRPPEAGDAMA